MGILHIGRVTPEQIRKTLTPGGWDLDPDKPIPPFAHMNGWDWTKWGIFHFCTVDPFMETQLTRALRYADNKTTVLITGPTGTGKEILARMMHQSPAVHNYVAVNIAAVAPTLFESELFGHVKGAFTGANDSRRGYFALAHEGTIFLDEIASIPLEYQSKLLRVLDTKTYWPVGAITPVKSDFRVVAATRYNLEEQIDKGLFLEDLYARLFHYELKTTGLKDRPVDVTAILRFMGCPVDPPDSFLDKYVWKYNVRGLQKWAAHVRAFGVNSALQESYV